MKFLYITKNCNYNIHFNIIIMLNELNFDIVNNEDYNDSDDPI